MLLSYAGDKVGNSCTLFFLMHLMNASISLFTISYCYRAQQTEAFSEEKQCNSYKSSGKLSTKEHPLTNPS